MTSLRELASPADPRRKTLRNWLVGIPALTLVGALLVTAVAAQADSSSPVPDCVSPTSTSSASPTATGSASPTATPTASPTTTPTPSASSSTSDAPSATPSSSASPSASASPSVSSGPTAGASPAPSSSDLRAVADSQTVGDPTASSVPTTVAETSPTVDVTPSGTPSASSSVVPEVTASATPSPTSSASSSANPCPPENEQGKPDPPTDVEVAAGLGSIEVTWTAPEYEGLAPITYYTATARVESTDPDDDPAQEEGESESGESDSEEPAATPEDSESPASPSSSASPSGSASASPSVSSSAPPAPTVSAAPSVSAFADSASVDGTPQPTASGSPGSPDSSIAEPTVPNPDDAEPLTCIATSALTCEIPNLRADTVYTVTVTATNSFGTSLPSERSEPISPKLVPGVPVTPRITELVARDGEVEVAVVAARKGNLALKFTVKAIPSGETCTLKVDESSCVVEDLTNDRAYRFTAVATNDFGNSLPTLPSNAVTPKENPDLPTPPFVSSVRVGNGKAEVQVRPGPGAPVTLYTITATPGDTKCTTDTNSCTFTELSNGTSYTFSAKAINSAGHSRASVASGPATPSEESERPDAPNIDSVTLGGQSATIEIVPGTAGGAPKSYTVVASPGGQSCSTAGSSCVVSGLNDSTSYTFTATATNQSGKSEASRIAIAPSPSPKSS